MIRAKAEPLNVPYEEMYRRYVSKASLGRMVTADDIAGTMVFLCSEAGRNISGQAISVDGDAQYIV